MHISRMLILLRVQYKPHGGYNVTPEHAYCQLVYSSIHSNVANDIHISGWNYLSLTRIEFPNILNSSSSLNLFGIWAVLISHTFVNV